MTAVVGNEPAFRRATRGGKVTSKVVLCGFCNRSVCVHFSCNFYSGSGQEILLIISRGENSSIMVAEESMLFVSALWSRHDPVNRTRTIQ